MILTKAGENLIPYVDEVLDSVDKLHNFEEDMKKMLRRSESGHCGDAIMLQHSCGFKEIP